MTTDLRTRLLCEAHDEWDISAESRALARDALVEIERMDAAARGQAWALAEVTAERDVLRVRLAAALVGRGEGSDGR